MRGFVLLAMALLILAGVGAGGYATFHNVLVPALDARLDQLRDYRPPVVSDIYDKDGQLMDRLYDERRFWVPLWDISMAMQNAVLAAEDRRFFEHPGFDYRGIARAFLVNAEAMDYRQGASTLTQQLVKHLLVGHQRTLTRKVEEVGLAWRLERRWSKSQILELYLNYVYFGEGNYGVEAAAKDYFDKSARDLDIAEAALLAGLIPSPSTTSPRKNPGAAIDRRNVVLDSMVEAGYVTEEAVNSLRYGESIPGPRDVTTTEVGTAYRSEVRRTLRRLLARDTLFDHGMRFETAYDPSIQAVAEDAVRNAAAAVEERNGHGGPVHILGYNDWELFFVKAPGLKRNPLNGDALRPQPGECLPAGFHHHYDRNIYAGPIAIRLSDAAWTTLIRARRSEEMPKPLSKSAEAGQVYRVCINQDGEADLQPYTWVQGAAAVIENKTGEVVALVGGVNMKLDGFNRASQARRQPGSAFKPVVYATAIENGRDQLDKVLDGPLTLRSGGSAWRPQNYDRWYRGWVTLRTALAKSLNTATVRLSMQVGTENVARTAEKLGLGLHRGNDPTIGLGSREVTPLALTSAFSTFAREGRAVSPAFITKVLDRSGNTIGGAGRPIYAGDVTTSTLGGGPGEQAISPAAAYQVLDMLREVIYRGTGKKAAKPGYDRAGKTGTSSDFADAWFVGMTPEYTVGVWIGCDQRLPLGDGEAGGKAALPAWLDIVEALESDVTARFEAPDGVRMVRYGSSRVAMPRRR